MTADMVNLITEHGGKLLAAVGGPLALAKAGGYAVGVYRARRVANEAARKAEVDWRAEVLSQLQGTRDAQCRADERLDGFHDAIREHDHRTKDTAEKVTELGHSVARIEGFIRGLAGVLPEEVSARPTPFGKPRSRG